MRHMKQPRVPAPSTMERLLEDTNPGLSISDLEEIASRRAVLDAMYYDRLEEEFKHGN